MNSVLAVSSVLKSLFAILRYRCGPSAFSVLSLFFAFLFSAKSVLAVSSVLKSLFAILRYLCGSSATSLLSLFFAFLFSAIPHCSLRTPAPSFEGCVNLIPSFFT